MAYLDPEEDIAKTWHNLPHWQQNNAWIFVTYRLADSLPEAKLKVWQEEKDRWLNFYPKPWTPSQEREYHRRFSDRVNNWLDQGYGSCLLARPDLSEIVANAFHHFDGERYLMNSFVVMPNHVHLLFSPHENHLLPDLLHTWKRFTAREINKRLDQKGPLWQADYWDRLIRSKEHFDWVRDYIIRNPKNLPNEKFHLYTA
jgi:type I restriction enzyme R subunit